MDTHDSAKIPVENESIDCTGWTVHMAKPEINGLTIIALQSVESWDLADGASRTGCDRRMVPLAPGATEGLRLCAPTESAKSVKSTSRTNPNFPRTA